MYRKSDDPEVKIPPDGGYGWVITFACSLKKIITIPIVFNFGLVLQKSYAETNVLPSEGNQVVVWRYTIEMLLSLFAGPILLRFGYRKVAVVGSLLLFVALVLTSTASNFWHLVFYYSIILSIGEAIAVPAFELALNSFFKEKRALAIGITSFCAGLGPTFLPLLMSKLLYAYGWRITVLVLSALSLLCLFSSCLLRPVKWYAKSLPILEETIISQTSATVYMTTSDSAIQNNTLKEKKKIGVKFLKRLVPGKLRSKTISEQTAANDVINKSQNKNLLPPMNTETAEPARISVVDIDKESGINKINDKKNVHKLIDFFDLRLLMDPVFVNILCGLCIGPSVEDSFRLMLPIILEDMMQLETSDIANLLSIIALSDIVFRLLGPYITIPWHKSPRVIYMITLGASIVARTVMLFTKTFHGMIYIALAIGISKGIRNTYLNVILPDYVSIDRLAYASGIVRFFRGITSLVIEQTSTHLRNTTASYKIPIILLNIFTLISILMWTAEILYLKFKKPKNEISNG